MIVLYQRYYDAREKTFPPSVREEFTLCCLRALAKVRAETRDVEDPVSLNGGSASLFYRLDDEIVMSQNSGRLPFRRVIQKSQAKNNYQYPEYESDFLVFHIKKVDYPTAFPDDASQRQLGSERNQLLLPGHEWEFSVSSPVLDDRPYGILTYCHNRLLSPSLYFGFPCPANEGKKWLFAPTNLYLEKTLSNAADVNNIDQANQATVKDRLRKRHTS